MITIERAAQPSLRNQPRSSRSCNHTTTMLHALKKRGLVSFETDQGRGGTIRPQCYARFYPEALKGGTK